MGRECVNASSGHLSQVIPSHTLLCFRTRTAGISRAGCAGYLCSCLAEIPTQVSIIFFVVLPCISIISCSDEHSIRGKWAFVVIFSGLNINTFLCEKIVRFKIRL
jgi:hypothetical protein